MKDLRTMKVFDLLLSKKVHVPLSKSSTMIRKNLFLSCVGFLYDPQVSICINLKIPFVEMLLVEKCSLPCLSIG